jgi:hypothetical protein
MAFPHYPRIALTVALAFISALPASAQGAGAFPAGFQDHAAARLKLQPAVISAPPARALAFADQKSRDGGMDTWVWVRKSDKDFTVSFTAGTPESESRPGDVSIKRSLDRGTVIQIRVELDPDIGSYLVLKAMNSDRTYLSVYSGGKAVFSNVILRSPIFYLFTVPMTRIAELAGGGVEWSLAFGGGETPDEEESGESADEGVGGNDY